MPGLDWLFRRPRRAQARRVYPHSPACPVCAAWRAGQWKEIPIGKAF